MSWISDLGEWLDDNIWQPVGEGVSNALDWTGDKLAQFENWLGDSVEDLFGEGKHRNDLPDDWERVHEYVNGLDIPTKDKQQLFQQLWAETKGQYDVGYKKLMSILTALLVTYSSSKIISDVRSKNQPVNEDAVLASYGHPDWNAKNPTSVTTSDIVNGVNVISNNVGNNSQSNQSSQDNNGLWSSLKNLLLGDTSLSANGSSLLSMLAGVGSQYASSVLNYDNQVRLIDKQNAYNTPQAQMERFGAAGLNPNLIYGLGSNGNQPSSGSIAPVDFDTSQRENRMAQLQFGLAAKQAAADIGLKQAQTRSAMAQSDYVNEQAIAQKNTNSIFSIIKQQYTAQLDQAIHLATIAKEQASTEKEKRQAEIELLRAQKAKEDFLSHSEQGKFAIDIRNFITNAPGIANDMINDLGNNLNSTFGK